MNCSEVPFAIDGFAGAIVMATRVAVPTVNVVLPVTPVVMAVISAVPELTPVASPAAPTVATAGFEELQLTEFVKFLVVPSE